MKLAHGVEARPAKDVPRPVLLLKRMLEIVHNTEFHVFEVTYARPVSLALSTARTRTYLFVGNPTVILVRYHDWNRPVGINVVVAASHIAKMLGVSKVVVLYKDEASMSAIDMAEKIGVMLIGLGEVVSFLRIHGEDI